MSILSCLACNGEFQAKSSSAKYCSSKCKFRARDMAHGLTCRICEKPMVKGRTSKPQGEAAHNACRDVHGSPGRYQRGCRCEVCRAYKAAKTSEYAKARKDADGITPAGQRKRKQRGIEPLAQVPCFVCGDPLDYVRTKAARYPMHKKCKTGTPTWAIRGLDEPDPIREASKKRRAAFQRKIDRAARGTSGKRVFVSGGCAWCEETFTAAAGVYCSDRCKVAAGFKRRSGGTAFKVSPRTRTAIYERDSWTCQLCAYPVNGTLSHRDNWAASLDHIIPQSHMLIPDHSPSNLRLVHRMCNSMRGDGSNMTKVELITRVSEHFQRELAA